MRSSWRWGPPIGGCKSFWKVLRTEMMNWANFFLLKSLPNISISSQIFFGQFCLRLWCENCHFLKAFFICSFGGALVWGSNQSEGRNSNGRFRGATNRMAVTAIADLGERHGFRGAANKSAVTAPLNEHMKKAFRKW